MTYRVQLAHAALKQLEALPDSMLARIDKKLVALSANPRPHGCLKLEGKLGPGFRVRVGDYRLLYTIEDKSRYVQVFAILPRDKAYKDF